MTLENGRNVQYRVQMGWVVMSMALIMMSLSHLMQAAMQTDFSEFAHHPGPEGWWVNCALLTMYGVVALAVGAIDTVWFRWLVLALALAALTYTLGHHIDHLSDGFVGQTFGPFGVIHLHHLASIWVVVNSFGWARAVKAQA